MQENYIIKTLGEGISTRRRNAGLTQEELAEILGITPDTMSRMEKGKFAPKMSRLPHIAEALNCSITDLFRTTDKKTLDRASTIADILKPLPDEGQEALVELMVQAVLVMTKYAR